MLFARQMVCTTPLFALCFFDLGFMEVQFFPLIRLSFVRERSILTMKLDASHRLCERVRRIHISSRS